VSALESGIYTGTLRHRRFQPVWHDFTYPLFMVFLDIDRIEELAKVSPFLSYNRWNWASFDERDHFGFNPVSFFYCYGLSGKLEAVLAEVSSTFGETRNYWHRVSDQKNAENALHFRTPKTMHVSPFMAMDLEYDFIFTPPQKEAVVHMNTRQQGKVFFDATLKLEKHPWTSESLHRILLRHPWMTAKVVGAIHWQALRLYFKKVPVFTHPGKKQAANEGKIRSAHAA